ncbi:hypothetical protein MKW92_030940 [Papaver armeniacum]|nr:hypothetical protein MKW92_030940 [Papaver armeniacum]
MGELDSRSFDKVFPASFPSKGGGRRETTEITKSVQLCSFWETNLRDQSWRPFKVIKVKGKQEEVIDEDDELLKSFKDEFGEEAYKALTTAAMELNEYNPSCREPVQEIWNFKERRRATTKEAISLVLKQLKSSRRKA